MRPGVLFGVLCGLLGAAGCVEVDGDRVAHLGLALTAPAANASEVRSLGFFAVSLIEPDFECASYLSGERDPIAQTPELLVAVDYQSVEQGTDGDQMTFSAVPAGELSIMVEAYDSGGSRIFLGCEQAVIEAGQANPIEMALVPDPTAP